jgi:hypothetical protein
MKLTNMHVAILNATGVAFAVLLLCVAITAQISQTAPVPNQNITAPGPQRHGPPAQPQPQALDRRAPQPLIQAPANGTVVGYVYWDTKSVTHTPANNCIGLGAAVSVGTPPKGSPTFEQFKILGTYHNFTYLGNVGSLAVCQYSIQQIPTGRDLQIQVGYKQPSFTPVVVSTVPSTANNPNGPIKISGGSCNKVPPAVPSATVLGSGWWTCGNYAYNVNFVLQPATAGNMLSSSTQITVLSATPQGGTNSSQNPTAAGMLSGNSRSGGMLAPGNTQGAQSSANSGTLLGNQQSTPGQGGGMQNPGSKVALNPQPFPPGPGGRALSRNGTLPGNRRIAVALGSPKKSSKTTNPKAALRDAAIIAVLQQPRKAADAESAAMKLGIRSAGVQAGTTPSHIMAANGGGAQRTAPTPNQNSALASSMQPPGLGVALPAHLNNLAFTCGQDPSMRALTVSGGPTPAIFTPDPKYNFYTITGCSFGSPGTNSKAYIYYQGTFREDFQIQQWTNNFIQLSLDQNISGVDDQNNVTLVLQRDDGKQWTKSSYKFYAARQTVLLSPIPRGDFSLNQFRPDQSVIQAWKPTYTSASSPSVVPNLPGLSAEVHWDITTDAKGNVLGGDDLYDFSHLHSTFALDSTQLEWRDLSCTDPKYNQFAASKNNWSIDWYGPSGIQVGWQGQVCNPSWGTCGNGITTSQCFANAPESNYGVNVWVSGPRGLDPWTGKPAGN